SSMTPPQRLARMRRTFAKNRLILVEDYEHFATPHVAASQIKAAHKSAGAKRAATKLSDAEMNRLAITTVLALALSTGACDLVSPEESYVQHVAEASLAAHVC